MSTPTPTTSTVLPSVMQQKMARLRNELTDNPPPQTISANPVSTPPPVRPAGNDAPNENKTQQDQTQDTQSETTTTNQTDTAADDKATSGDRITLSREEFDDLKANAGRVTALQARERDAMDRLEEVRHRLTELENGNKGSSNPAQQAPSSATPVVDTASITFTPEEREQYDESRPYIEKVVDLRLAERLNALVPELRSMVEDARKQASTAVNTVQQANTRTFHSQVQAQVPDLQQIIKHKHWDAFLDETEPMSGATYDQLLAHSVQRQSLSSVVAIYNGFRNRYMHSQQQAANAGFAGASTSGGASSPAAQTPQPTKLKLSDRKKASEDYRKGRITWNDLQEVNKKFDAAEKSGSIDYDA